MMYIRLQLALAVSRSTQYINKSHSSDYQFYLTIFNTNGNSNTYKSAIINQFADWQRSFCRIQVSVSSSHTMPCYERILNIQRCSDIEI